MSNETTQVIYFMNRVGKIVPPNKQILRDISLGFYYGAKIGVLGLNGAGARPHVRSQAQSGSTCKWSNNATRAVIFGTKLKAIFGSLANLIQLLGQTTAYIERSNLTSRLFNGRQTRKTLAFSKDLSYCRAAATWEDSYYNLVKPHKSLRLPVVDIPGRKWKPRTPAMAAELTDHTWTVLELLSTILLKC